MFNTLLTAGSQNELKLHTKLGLTNVSMQTSTVWKSTGGGGGGEERERERKREAVSSLLALLE
jgi:hypothetical protein